MKIFDRLNINQPLSSMEQLPSSIELGRYYLDNGQDLTNRTVNVGLDKRILQELLEEKNDGSMKLFRQFFEDVNTEKENIVPLLQDITDKLHLNSFELMLKKEMWHIENICRQPYFLLYRDIEKVNVARAKRISNRSYGYLSSHTEDWFQKSIVSFKPRKILNEELDEFYNVYENKIVIAFILRCIRYLSNRIDELEKIEKILQDKDVLLIDRDDENKWYKKIDRNLTIIGRVYSDESNSSGKIIANDTRKDLILLQNRLKATSNSIIFSKISIPSISVIMTEPAVRPTNVTVNHKHYRYLRDLWKELNNYRKEQTEEEYLKYEQEVIQGVRDYSLTAIYYSVKEYLNFEIEGSYKKWKANHKYYYPIDFEVNPQTRIMKLSIGEYEINIVTICCELVNMVIPPKTLVLYYQGNNTLIDYKNRNEDIINISPYDPDTIERIAKYIRSKLTKILYTPLFIRFSYDKGMIDYIRFVEREGIVFDNKKLEYFFTKPIEQINSEDVNKSMEEDRNFLKKNYKYRNEVKEKIRSFIERINVNIRNISKSLVCPDCGEHIKKHTIDNLKYLRCYCGFVVRINEKELEFKNKEDKYNHLTEEDWGMDYIKIPIKDDVNQS